VQSFRDLKIWQRGLAIAKAIYAVARGLPVEERFAMANQLRRAAVSVPTNIAEGSRRTHPKDFAHFLNIAEGSAAELESLLVLTVELGYQRAEVIDPLVARLDELRRMIVGFRRALEKQEKQPSVISSQASAPD
jgi:four helix bundle protein